MTESIWEWWKEKTSSTVYFTYVLAFISWNWKAIYILFRDSSNSDYQQKFLYISEEIYFGGTTWFDWIQNHAWAVLMPIVITYVLVKYLPKINTWAHEIETESYFIRKRKYDDMAYDHEEKRKKVLEKHVETRSSVADLLEKLNEGQEKIEKTLTPEQKLKSEYLEFKETSAYHNFSEILEKIYSNSNFVYNFQPADLATLDGYLLVVIDGNNSVTLTDKGRQFSKLFSTENRGNGDK